MKKLLKGISPTKYKMIKEILSKANDQIQDILRECELIGINERVTYHKIQKDEKVPYTHIFDNASIIVKHKKLPLLLIYSPGIKYIRNFIEG